VRCKQQANNHTSHARHKRHVACHLDGTPTTLINAVGSEKTNIGGKTVAWLNINCTQMDDNKKVVLPRDWSPAAAHLILR
jgi:uncharacterized Zn-binding protein involved in type VI secretion